MDYGIKGVIMTKEERLAKLKSVMKGINKTQGKAVLNFADTEVEWERASTGIKELDDMIGGGFAYGHTSICWGGSGAGKSTLMYSTVAQAQKEGKIVAFLDLENSFENERATTMGVNCKDMVIGHYDVAEEALDTIIKLAIEGVVDVIILDSIHSMATKGAVEDKKGLKSLETNTMGALAKKLGEFFARASTRIFKSNIALIMVGQTRKNLGGFIVLDKLSGGNALIHNSVLTLHQRRGQKSNAPHLECKVAFLDPDGKFHLQKEKTQNGFETVIKIDKKKCSGGFNEGTAISLPYHYDTGFIVPNPEDMEIKIDPKMNEEQVKIIKKALVKKGYTQFEEEMSPTEFIGTIVNHESDLDDFDSDNNCANDITNKAIAEDCKDAVEKISNEESGIINMVEESIEDLSKVMDISEAKEKIKVLKKKRGRGRPKGKKK